MQYAQVRAIEHVHPLVRSRRELERVLKDVEAAPGIVLYTLFNRELTEELEKPLPAAEDPLRAGAEADPAGVRILSRHARDPDRRRPARARRRLFPPHRRAQLHHAARRRPAAAKISTTADIILLGISRTSKTPTCDLSRQSRLQDRQFAAGARHRAARRSWKRRQRLRGRPGGEPGAHRRNPPEPRDRCTPTITSTTMSTATQIADEIAQTRGAVRAARLADHRRDAPLDRGDGGHHHPPLPRPRSAGAGGMSSFLQAGRAAADPGLGEQVARAACSKRPGSPSSSSRPGSTRPRCARRVSGKGSLGPHDVAEVLARAKAEAVSDLAPKAYVIGADQVLALGDTIFSKPDSMEAARRQLLDLQRQDAHSCTPRWRSRPTARPSGRRRRLPRSPCASSRRSSSAVTSRLPARRC